MAAKRRRSTSRRRTTRRAATSNPARRRRLSAAPRATHRKRRTRRNGMRVVKVYNPSRRRSFRRRSNPGFLTGKAGSIFGVLGGAAVTKLIIDRLPAGLTSGILGIAVTAIVAKLQGSLVGKFLKNPSLGNNMAMGGYVLAGLQGVSMFVPGASSYLPFGLKGMGAIYGSSFYTPQVPLNNSMNQFVTPSAIPRMLPAPVQNGRGMGGLRVARGGRMS